jgi:hypothetical protein
MSEETIKVKEEVVMPTIEPTKKKKMTVKAIPRKKSLFKKMTFPQKLLIAAMAFTLLLHAGLTFYMSMYQRITLLYVDGKEVTLNSDRDFVSRFDVNKKNQDLIYNGDYKRVFDFYDTLIKNEKVTGSILKYSHDKKIPVNLVVALCYVESKFKPNAVGKNGSNGSFDYGLFQLNSNTFKSHDKKYLMLIDNNVDLATEHLKTLFDKYLNWEESTVAYNGGNTSDINNLTLKHFVSVMKYERDLDVLYNRCFIYGSGMGLSFSEDEIRFVED